MNNNLIAIVAASSLAVFSVTAAENSFTVANGGDWGTPSNWSLGSVPGSDDDVVINITAGKTVLASSAINVKSLTITKGDLKVQAGTTAGVSVSDWQSSAALLWANRLAVTIANKLSVSNGANLFTANDPETGTPVAITCGELDLAAGGKISADRLGYQWVEYTGGTAPANTFSDNSGSKFFYTYAPGHGQSFGNSGGHGGYGAGYSTIPSSLRGLIYGYEAAPFMSGSPVGTYNGNLDYPAPGSVVIFVNGHARVDGVLSATETGTKRGHGCNSGGSVWLCAATLDISPTASITARGGTSGGSYQAPGAGGRVAIGLGLTSSDIESLAAGTPVADISGLTQVNAYGCECDSLAGLGRNGAGTRGNNGTAVIVYRPASVVIKSIESDPANFGTANPGYGFHAYAIDSVPAFTGPEPSVRDGWRGMRKFTTVTREDIVTTQPGIIWRFGGDKVLCTVKLVGSGSVSFNGDSHIADFQTWVDYGSTVTLTAGNGFSAWYGDIAGGKNENASISATASAPLIIQAVFEDATGNTITYSGGANGFWDEAANWNPATVPGPLDNVTIPSGKSVRGINVLAVNSLSVSGSLALGGSTANATTAQTLNDLNGGLSGLYVADDLTIASGCMTLGSRSTSAPVICSTVGGNLNITGSGKLSVFANVNNYALSGNFADVYADHTVFNIGENLSLSNTATIYPVADEMSGTPVEWKVGGDFTLSASSKIDCTNLGFGWVPVNDSRARESANIGGTMHYTLSPGLPIKSPDYNFGANYGGDDAASISSKYAAPYGNKYAPFMPGSASSCYNGQAINAGGGTAWINAKGEMELAGRIIADGPRPSNYSGPSGGAIWLIAKKITAESTALLSAEGGKNAHSTLWASGSGGRISLAIGMKDSDIDAIVAGTEPSSLTGVTVTDDISLVPYSIRGGTESTKTSQGVTQYGPSGTATTLTGAAADTVVTVSSSPVLVGGITYGPSQKPQGETATFTAPASGSVSGEESAIRYSLSGWVCSNTTELVASGNGTTATFLVSNEPLTLTWIWCNRETRTLAAANDSTLGSINVNGTPSQDGIVWANASTDITLTAIPEAGCEFLYWVGDFPFGKVKGNPLTVKGGIVRNLSAVFRESENATTRIWAGSGDSVGNFLDPAKWDPSGVPGISDALIITNGTVFATNAIVCGSLEIGGSAIVRLAACTLNASYNRKDIDYSDYIENSGRLGNNNCLNYTRPIPGANFEEACLFVADDFVMSGKGQLTIGAKDQEYRSSLTVGGDLLMLGTNKLMVVAGVTDDIFTFVRGAGFITISNKLLVGGSSILYPVSEGYTGGSVVIRSSIFEVGEDASVDAINAGWKFFADRIPNTLAPGYGYDYTIAGGYGGYGMRSNIQMPESWATYGLPYGQEYAPIHPGSCKGSYSDQTRRGGGLIRVHAQSTKIDGTLNANAAVAGKDDYLNKVTSSGSGGGIWVTSEHAMQIGPNAKFLARGGYRCYPTSYSGGGGRISLCECVTPTEVEELATTGTIANRQMPTTAKSLASLTCRFPGALVDVACGEMDYDTGDRAYDPKYDGTFIHIPVKTRSIFLLK